MVKITGVEGVAPNYGSLCVKGRFGFDFIGSPERLKTPLIREKDGFREATWEEALDLVARRLGEIKAANGPDSIGVLTSARITNEENYIAQKFTRAVLQDQQHRPLRPSLTLLHRGRSGRSLRQRGDDQHHRRHRAGRRDPDHRLQHHRESPRHRERRQARRAPEGQDAHRGRPPAHQDQRLCPHLAQAPPRHRCRLDQRHAARDHRREPAREGIRGKPHHGLRGAQAGRCQIHPGACRSHHGHPRPGPDGGRAPLCRGRARQHPLLHGDHPAHHRHRQRQVARQPCHALRPPGDRRRRGEPPAGSEQRAGRLRHGRTAGCVFRLPEGDGRPGPRPHAGGLGRRRPA